MAILHFVAVTAGQANKLGRKSERLTGYSAAAAAAEVVAVAASADVCFYRFVAATSCRHCDCRRSRCRHQQQR